MKLKELKEGDLILHAQTYNQQNTLIISEIAQSRTKDKFLTHKVLWQIHRINGLWGIGGMYYLSQKYADGIISKITIKDLKSIKNKEISEIEKEYPEYFI